MWFLSRSYRSQRIWTSRICAKGNILSLFVGGFKKKAAAHVQELLSKRGGNVCKLKTVYEAVVCEGVCIFSFRVLFARCPSLALSVLHKLKHHQVKTHGAHLRMDCLKLDFATKFVQNYGTSSSSCFVRSWNSEFALVCNLLYFRSVLMIILCCKVQCGAIHT